MSNINPQLLSFANGMRESYRALIPSAGTPDHLFSVKDLLIPHPKSEGNVPARLYTPTENPLSELYPLVLFVHGGGWVSGDLDTHDVLIRALSLRLNAVVLSVNYRLSPEYNAIDQIDDVAQSFDWLYENAESLKGDKKKIIGAGDSAGGALIANLAHRLRDRNEAQKMAAQWLMYPSLSLDVDTPSFEKYGTVHFPTIDVIKHVTACSVPHGLSSKDPKFIAFYAEHNNIAPTIMSVAGFDPLTSNTEQYARDLQSQGVKNIIKHYPDQEHGFMQFFKDKEKHYLGEKAINDGIDTLKDWLNIR